MELKNKVQAKLELNWNPLLFSPWEIFKQLKNNMQSKNHKRVCGDTAKAEAKKEILQWPKMSMINPDF